MSKLMMLGTTAALLSVSMTAQTQVRCGTELINVDDFAADALRACGEPYSKNVDLFGDDRWIYNFGPDEFMMILTIRDGRIIDMESGDYGFIPP